MDFENTQNVARTIPSTSFSLQDFVDAIAEKVEKQDPVVMAVTARIEEQIKNQEIDIPRLPDVASRILEFSQNPDASTKDVVRHMRNDPVLAGKVIEISNSAMFAGSQPVFSLQMAIVRLGLNRVAETALHMSVNLNAFHKDKRSNMLTRLWKFALATGFACEELAKLSAPEKQEAAFLTGIFHAIASPAIVSAIGKLERTEGVPVQSDSRVLGLIDRLTIPMTERVVSSWKLPKEAQEAIHLQDRPVRDRRNKPLAHLLVCAKEVVTELGLGVRPAAIDLSQSLDFKFIGVKDTAQLVPVREAVQDKMLQIGR
jgi:HD-like signal output (HDOD) protein